MGEIGDSAKLRLAIVEDNATARTTLRSNLLSLGVFDIASFSTGSELKATLRKQNFEIFLFDFHLGQSRNGVEWVQELRQNQFIKPSAGVLFITADNLPHTIGQILDAQPDALFIKPYTLASLKRGLQHYLNYRHFVRDVLGAMDEQQPERAINLLQILYSKGIPARLQNDVDKLHARLLISMGKLNSARAIFDNVLSKSDKVLWAQWGRIKCQYLAGDWPDCKDSLASLVQTKLTHDKAFEWLASLSFQQQAYAQAEYYLDHINLSDLSIPATRMKSVSYQKQNRLLEGIDLLQRKREHNRSSREHFDAFTFELADFYVQIAQQAPSHQREESLTQARRLIGIAKRKQSDQQWLQREDYLLAQVALLEGDNEKAKRIVDAEHMQNMSRCAPATLINAAKVMQGLGDSERAAKLLEEARLRVDPSGSLSQQALDETSITLTETDLGLASERAMDLNDQGTRYFVNRNYHSAIDYFYRAWQLLPSMPAFTLNLMQCMLETQRSTYKSTTIKHLLESLATQSLNPTNKSRLAQLREVIYRRQTLFLPPDPTDELVAVETANSSSESNA